MITSATSLRNWAVRWPILTFESAFEPGGAPATFPGEKSTFCSNRDLVFKEVAENPQNGPMSTFWLP